MKKTLLSGVFLLSTFISANAQFSQSFEGSTTTPAGWSVIAGGDTGQTWVITDLAASAGISAQNGTNVFSINYGTTAHNDFLVTPQIAVVAGVSDKLTFWGRSRDANFPETISVKASMTTATAAAFTTTLAATIAPAGGTSFYKYTIDLASFAGQSIYVGFHSQTTDQFVFDIDNVVVGTTMSCIEPTSALTFTNVTNTSLNLAWTAATPAPAQGYDIYYSTSGVAPTSATAANLSVAAGVVTTPVTGLTPGSKYYFYVRSKCSATSSSVWGQLGTILTAFTPVAPPYSYGFDNAAGYLPDGWTGTWSTNATAGNPQAGTQMIFSNNSITAATNRWLFSRPFSLEANSVNTITFYVRNFGAAPIPPQSFKLTTANTNVIADHTNVVYTSSTLANNTWTQITASFTPTTTGIYYFGFHHFSPVQATTVSFALDTFAISSVLSTKEFSTNSLNVYPNPSNGLVNISTDSNYSLISANISDLNGRTVKTLKLNGESTSQINISDLAAGVYMMNIASDQGSVTKKIVKN